MKRSEKHYCLHKFCMCMVFSALVLVEGDIPAQAGVGQSSEFIRMRMCAPWSPCVWRGNGGECGRCIYFNLIEYAYGRA